MNAVMTSLTHGFLRKFVWMLAAVAVVPAMFAQADDDDVIGAPVGAPSPVIYNPDTLQSAQGEAPFNFSYQLTITSPAALPVGIPQTIGINLALTASPAGSSAGEAIGFISSSQPTVTFTGPGETQTITINLAIPSGTETGSFSYLITTTGWPTVPGYTIQDNGTRVNARVDPPSGLVAPTVAITSPVSGSSYIMPAAGPLLVPVAIKGSATNNAVIRELTATISGVNSQGNAVLATQPLSFTLTGLGTANALGVVATGFPITQPGIYTVVAFTRNDVGNATTSSTFVVDAYMPTFPPTVEITSPAPNSSFPLSYASTTGIKMDFTGMSQTVGAVITKLTHKLDNGAVVEVSSSTLNQPTAYGTITLPVTTPGVHTFTVTATDIYGTATDVRSFVVVDDTPVYRVLSGSVFLDANLDGVRQSTETGIAGVNVTLKNASTGAAIDTATTAANGVYSFSVQAGSYVVAVTDLAGYLLTTGNNHTVTVGNAAVTAPNTGYGIVVQPSPVALSGVVYYDANSNGARDLPADYGLSGVSVQLLSTTNAVLATKTTSSTGAYSFSVLPGTYKVSVANVSGLTQTTATPRPYTIVVDAAGATAPETGFGPPPCSTISGVVFFDVNQNGVRNTEDYGIAKFTVKLFKAGTTTVVATTTTASNGTYSFAKVAGGNYVVRVYGIAGLDPTTYDEWNVTANGMSVTVPDTGYGLNFAAIKCLKAGGYTIGYWKNNVDKAIAKKTSGCQVNAATITAYTNTIASLALDPFAGLTLSQASSIMGSNSSNPVDLLRKQLVASEYNYANGANGGYINGSQTLTYAFIYWAEYVVKNASSFSSSYILWVKDMCDAYNNSHGGYISCTTTGSTACGQKYTTTTKSYCYDPVGSAWGSKGSGCK